MRNETLTPEQNKKIVPKAFNRKEGLFNFHVVLDLYAEVDREPALKAAIRPFQDARRRRVSTLVDRAVARGEASTHIDRETATDFIVSALFWRVVVTGGRSDRRHLERFSRMTAAAVSVA